MGIRAASKYKIALLTCWYGQFPWYFPYFLHSCKFNPTVDFFIITDNTTPIFKKPLNVKFIHKPLQEIIEISTKKMGFKVNISRVYKLCDLKPAYGFIFPEIIKGYDFWGHADIDLIYGNIRDFVTDEVLASNDVISSRHDYVTGTFCLFRNNKDINRLFMKSKDYRLVLTSSENFCFDECNYLFDELSNGNSIFDYPERIQSMTYVVQDEARNRRLRAFFDFIIIEGIPGKIKWEAGRIIYKNKYECMFYHLIGFKASCTSRKVFKPIPNQFHISPHRIYIRK